MDAVEQSYVALRADRSPKTEVWWAEAARSEHAPPSVAALLTGRTRLELSVGETDAALAWAATVTGWAELDPKPLRVHSRD